MMGTQHSSAQEIKPPADRAGFDRLVYAIVRSIPSGRVMTYGAVAALIPPPQDLDSSAYRRIRARWVGYALARCPADVPWHRVVNAQGRPSPRPSGSHLPQAALLRDEAVPFAANGRVDLARASWQPQLAATGNRSGQS